jgi:2-polyprenyl-3-methyl-5-hydroxy-6-metoxy-1,4-benzoquinol methylase
MDRDQTVLEEAARSYFSNGENLGHFDRAETLRDDQDIASWMASIIALRVKEIGRWREAWGERAPIAPRRVLDAGCGPGFVAAALATVHDGAEIVGIDVESEAVELGRALCARFEGRVRVEQVALEEINANLGLFDLIVCRTVLEHVRDPRESVRRLIGALAPGGALFVETPNYLFPYEPHLRTWMAPRGPRWLLRLRCRMTGHDPSWVNHLRLEVDARTLPRWARESGDVEVYDLMAEKARRVVTGHETPAVASRERAVRALRRVSPAQRLLVWLAGRVPIWPSVQLLVVRGPKAPDGAR